MRRSEINSYVKGSVCLVLEFALHPFCPVPGRGCDPRSEPTFKAKYQVCSMQCLAQIDWFYSLHFSISTELRYSAK